MTKARWQRYVALGDSITEGFCDPIVGRGEPWLGWADRLAMILDGNARLSGSSIEFANLGVRGRRVADVVDDQVPMAIALEADLVSLMIGGNDLMLPKADPDALAAKLETGVAALRREGIDVLLANCFDPRISLFLKPLRGRAAVYNANVWTIARTYGTFTLDVWGIRELQARSMWADDRVHLTPAGHRLLAKRAAHALGIPYFELAAASVVEAEPVLPAPAMPTHRWFTQHVLPWIGRRMRRVTSGDGIDAKLPLPMGVETRY